jgi:hypothetical protein
MQQGEMMQREKPGPSKEHLEDHIYTVTGTSVICKNISGGQIENFREGWARNIFTSGKTVHYYKRVGFASAKSACLLSTAEVRWLYGRGNYPECKRCAKLILGG